MKSLKDFEKEINKCSKCGLCQAVCPVFKETKNDCAVSKGKFIMLKGVLNNDLKLNKNINKYLDMCLKCGKCKDFCPSDIDVCKIFETAKYEFVKNTFWGKVVFFLQSKYVFGNLLKLINKKQDIKCANAKLKLLYFRGCAGKFSNHTTEILKNFDNIEVIEKDFECCGIPFLSSGNLERFEEVKNRNVSLIEKSDFDYILTDCASCESTLKNYFDNDKYKFINLGELIENSNFKLQSKKELKVTFHKPCHLENSDYIEKLLTNIEGIKYIKCDGFDDCCGFAGEFALKNPKLSLVISKKKAENIIKSGADYVVTCCPACILGLKQGLSHFKNAPKVIDLSKFLVQSRFNDFLADTNSI